MRNTFFSAVFLFAVCGHRSTAFGQSVPTLTFTPLLTTGLSQPLDIARPPADTTRLFIVQKGGTVRIYTGGALSTDTFLNIASVISYSSGNERGLLSLAFHPQYATNRFFYVFYTNTAGDLTLARYQTQSANPARADAGSGVVLKTIPHPGASNHNGGKLIFGADGFLYLTTGDGGGSGDPNNNAQSLSSLLGKMLRFAVNTSATPPYYTAPVSNPFVGQAGADSLVYQFGLRNAYRWSFDRLTNDFWIADVGQGAWEEVDYTLLASAPGRDWGWRCREGAHVYSTTTACSTNYSDPVFEYDHTMAAGGLSITGGYVYRGQQYAALYGRYICVDYVYANGWTVAPNGSGGFVGTKQSGIPTNIAGFGEDHRGELYAVELNGRLYAVGSTGGTSLGIREAGRISGVTVSPVPAKSGSTITLRAAPGLQSAVLLDVQGRKIFGAVLTSADDVHTLALPALPSGIYMLRCTAVDGETATRRISVQ